MYLKRLRDLDGKKIVWTEGPSGKKCQVWTDESGNLYIYNNAQWLTYNGAEPAGQEYDKSSWVNLTDQVVGFYDKEDATELYSWDHGDDAYYQFVDWDGTVLKSGTVIEGGTPTAPADPTRAATAQYIYTFAGWQPTVGPINKNTKYVAQYTATPRNYTVTIESNNSDYGTVDTQQVTVAYGTEIFASSNVLTIGGATATATPTTDTAQYDYEFTNFTIDGTAVTETTVQGDTTIVANFTRDVKNYTITVSAGANGSVSPASVTAPYGTTITQSTNTLLFSNGTTVTATANTGYEFDSWSNVPATVTANATVSVSFVASQPSVIKFNTDYPTSGIEYVANSPIEIYDSSFYPGIELYNSNNSLVSSAGQTGSYQQGLSPYAGLETQASRGSCQLRFNISSVKIECVIPNNYWNGSTTKTNFATLFGELPISWESGTFESTYDVGLSPTTCQTVKGTLSLQQDSGNYYLPVDLYQWDYYFQNGDIPEGKVIFNVSDSSGNNPIGFMIAPLSSEPPMD